ncbi:hypothetical protein AX774_g2267 [Zancudomyces culisetae]|uniref:Uncharacterized protein n=1 Tax=Zancudomyces culisetae TaxID=1213189 RepID=A0A1R1PTE6_ZANCU|nr:hypothetical protein AX774_g2267 [Zancudomyces culisetae]|eukprot:OMH84214.1 hypothetical protein AX774_g2267 [Zancudomyces culisetae]
MNLLSNATELQKDSIPTGRWLNEVVSDLSRSKICILVRHIPSKNCAVASSTKDGASVSLFLTERVTILFDSPPRSRPTKKFRHPSLLPLSSLLIIDMSGIRSRVLYLTPAQYLQSSNMCSIVSALFFFTKWAPGLELFIYCPQLCQPLCCPEPTCSYSPYLHKPLLMLRVYKL